MASLVATNLPGPKTVCMGVTHLTSYLTCDCNCDWPVCCPQTIVKVMTRNSHQFPATAHNTHILAFKIRNITASTVNVTTVTTMTTVT